MKLSSFALLLALVPFTSAVDSPPNLRGIAVALTDGESRYHGVVVTPPCKTETKWCSTSPTAPDSHKCCADLTCTLDPSVEKQGLGMFNGVCGPTAPGGGRYGAPCRGVGLHCSTSPDAPVTHTCCKSESMNLTCNKDDSVAAQSSSSTFDGVCGPTAPGGGRYGGGDDEEEDK